MAEGRFSISAASLYARLGTAAAPVLIDVRRAGAFDAEERMLIAAVRRDPADVAQWGAYLRADKTVVVYCAHGREVSQQTAVALRTIGLDARYLEGGMLSLGLSANFANDHDMLQQGLVMYSAFYAWCRSCQDEKHNWNPALA